MFISAVIQGEGLWPTNRFLRGVPLRPPPGCDLGAGGRLEDCEWRRRRIGLCVGDEDGSEAVGDAQQVGFFLSSEPLRGKNHMQLNSFQYGFL